MVQLLGFQITRANDDKEKPAEAKQAFTVPSPDDGTTTISAGGYFGQYLDMEVTAKNDSELIRSCLLYTSPSPRDRQKSRMPSSA